MRIECPSCAAAYEVPPERLAAGRTVKCARCATAWSPVPLAETPIEAAVPKPVMQPEPPHVVEPPVPQPEPKPEPKPGPLDVVEPPAMPRRGRAPLVAAWVVSIALLAALGWLAIDRRAAIMQAWPPSARAYAVLGLLHHH